jgi:uncharacterized membrane protein
MNPPIPYKARFFRLLPILLGIGVLVLLVVWMLLTPAGLLGKADAIGYAVCHRIDVRSFHMGERALPLCARCTGMYLGALLGLLYQHRVASRRAGFPARRVWVVWALFVLAFGIDGLNSYLHLIPGAPGAYEPHNWLRLLTGTLMGLVMAGVIYPAFQQTAWSDWQDLPATRGLGDVLILVALGLVLDAIVLTENPLVLFPLALLSAMTVVGILTIVYTMIWVMMLHRENLSLRLTQLLLPLIGGFGLAMLQIVGLDLIRYALTGTWDGFHIG